MVIKTKTRQQIHDWFASQWDCILKDFEDEYKEGKLYRMERMFRGLSGKESIVFNDPYQRPYTFYLPDLPTKMFYDANEFELAHILEENYEMIYEELQQLLYEEERENEFTEYVGDGINSDKASMTNSDGQWKVFYFWQQFIENTDNTSRCPKTFKLLQNLKEKGLILSGMVCFSSIMPGTEILVHTGPSNMRLTCHLGLCGCTKDTIITVGTESSPFKQSKCIIFDDSFLHGVQHKGTERRITLMLDLWHPEMNATEIEVFKRVMNNSSTFMHPDEFFHSLKLVNTKTSLFSKPKITIK